MRIIEDYVPNGSWDYVRCNNCETEMLVPVGVMRCPHCMKKGCLTDLEEPDDWQELSPVHFKPCKLPENYDPLEDKGNTRVCEVCGKHVASGFLFDGTDCFCSKECATKFFDNDEGCVDILIDDGDRLVWHDSF